MAGTALSEQPAATTPSRARDTTVRRAMATAPHHTGSAPYSTGVPRTREDAGDPAARRTRLGRRPPLTARTGPGRGSRSHLVRRVRRRLRLLRPEDGRDRGR